MEGRKEVGRKKERGREKERENEAIYITTTLIFVHCHSQPARDQIAEDFPAAHCDHM